MNALADLFGITIAVLFVVALARHAGRRVHRTLSVAEASEAVATTNWLAQTGVRLRNEAGDTMIEVLIAALLVALISGAVLTGYIGIAALTGGQRSTSQADALAQSDEARMHSLSVVQLADAGAGTGNQTVTTTLGGTTYTVTSSAKFVSGGNGGSSCSGTTSADEVATTSTVTWGSTNGGRAPVVVGGLITPAVGGSLVVTTLDQSGAALGGATVSLTGPSAVSSLTTDASGCAVFGALTGGAYTVNVTAPNGYVTANGASSATQDVTVVATQTARPAAEFQFGLAGSIAARFTSTYSGVSHQSSATSIMASNTGMVTPLAFDAGGTYDTTLVSSSTLYPFGTPYSVYAGSCTADAPPSADQGSASVGGAAASVPLPALFVNVLGPTVTTYDDPNSAITYAGLSDAGQWTHNTGVSGDFDTTESDSNTLGDSASMSITAAAGNATTDQWITSYTRNGGVAQVYLDNVLVKRVDTYSPSTQYQQVAYQSPTLTTGANTLKIVVTGTNDGNQNGSTSTVAIDEMSVTVVTPPTLMTTAPHIILTDTGCSNYKSTPATVAPSPTTGALADPGVPYANLTVCADNGVSYNTAVVAQNSLSFTAGTIVNIYLQPGASGLSSGVCS